VNSDIQTSIPMKGDESLFVSDDDELLFVSDGDDAAESLSQVENQRELVFDGLSFCVLNRVPRRNELIVQIEVGRIERRE
jgi:hypothetical protein